MDCGALHLKPYVTLGQDNTEPDTPKEDKAIRPYPNRHESESLLSHGSDQSQVPDMDGSVDQLDGTESQAENNNIRDRKWTEGVVEDKKFDAKVNRESVDDETDQEKTNGSGVGIEPEQVDPQNSRPEDKHKGNKYTCSSPKKHNHKQRIAYYRHHSLQSMVLELTKNFFNGTLKASGKRQKQRKLNLFGAFDVFHYLEPAPVSVIVLPANRQNMVLGQDPNGQEASPPPRPSRGRRSWPPDSIYGLPWATFKQELHRLGTFMSMPPDFPISFVRLAEVGFLCLPDGVIVCYFCGMQHDQWNVSDSALEIHKQLSPSCSILSGVNCDNIPVRTLNTEETEALMEIWSVSRSSRLSESDPSGQVATVEPHTSAPSSSKTTPPENITRPRVNHLHKVDVSDSENSPYDPPGSEVQVTDSASGQVSAGSVTVPGQNASTSNNQAKQTVVVSSNQVSQNVSVSQSIEIAGPSVARASIPQQQQSSINSVGGEASNANQCTGSGNVVHAPILDGTAQPEVPRSDIHSRPANEARSGHRVVTYQQLRILVDAPKRPDMAMVNKRVATFRNWPSSHTQTPLALAEAGFYYAGYADCGRCFFCSGGLKNWEPADNPWVEHARWFPKCNYVRLTQSQDFVDIVSELSSERERQPISMAEVQDEIRRRRAGGDHIEEPVVDPAISSALHVGFSQGDIDAVAHRLLSEGHLVTAERLLDYLGADGAVATGGADSLEGADADLKQVEELLTENSEIRQRRMCKICLDKEVCVVFLPCGHLVCCAECSPALRNCPMCRSKVKGRVRAFPA